MRSTADRLVSWMRQRAEAAGADGFVVGMSGGVDSAVVARLSQLATPSGVVGVILPCHSDPVDEADARVVAEQFKVPTVRVDLEPAYDAVLGSAGAALDGIQPGAARGSRDEGRRHLALANVKPRLRMTALYFIANSLNALVAGTGNGSEVAIGYYTKYGDGGVDLLPIGRLLKSQVRALARELGVPDRIINKPPTAGLWRGQTDEGEMGFTYDDLERYLIDGAEAVGPAVAARIERLMRATDHKRALPPMPD
jgi:NAD+ synthase